MILAKALIRLALPAAALAVLPVHAGSLPSREAFWHIGQTATVSGRAFLTFMPSGEVYVDLDGQGEHAPLEGYISRWNRIRFGDVSALNGKTIEISGEIETFRAQPEIFLTDPRQISVK
jgi:hypothetical protein